MKLSEMPMLIPYLPSGDDLDIFNVNRAKFQELIKLPNKIVYKKFDDKRIVYSVDRMFFCLDLERKEVTYYMHYETNHNSILGSFLWQSLIWRSKNVSYIKPLPHDIFFNKLIPKYGVITTDGDQTNDGKRFWEYQIDFAITNHYFVYYYNLQTKDLVPIISMLEFDRVSKQYEIWGNDKSFRNKLVVISQTEL